MNYSMFGSIAFIIALNICSKTNSTLKDVEYLCICNKKGSGQTDSPISTVSMEIKRRLNNHKQSFTVRRLCW